MSYPGRLVQNIDCVKKLKYLNIFLALQCRLECEPGYVAQRVPVITCVNGEYEKRVSLFDTK